MSKRSTTNFNQWWRTQLAEISTKNRWS